MKQFLLKVHVEKLQSGIQLARAADPVLWRASLKALLELSRGARVSSARESALRRVFGLQAAAELASVVVTNEPLLHKKLQEMLQEELAGPYTRQVVAAAETPVPCEGILEPSENTAPEPVSVEPTPSPVPILEPTPEVEDTSKSASGVPAPESEPPTTLPCPEPAPDTKQTPAAPPVTISGWAGCAFPDLALRFAAVQAGPSVTAMFATSKSGGRPLFDLFVVGLFPILLEHCYRSYQENGDRFDRHTIPAERRIIRAYLHSAISALEEALAFTRIDELRTYLSRKGRPIAAEEAVEELSTEAG